MASVRDDQKKPARTLAGVGGQIRFAGVVVRCEVCGGVITSMPTRVYCEEGYVSGPVHEWCVDRWECS